MKSLSAILLAFMGLLLPIVVFAQSTPVVLDRLQIEIWPEYDRTDVLVMYKMTLSAQTTLPAEVKVRIPLSAGMPYNVAMQDVDGLLYNLDYTVVTDGNFLVVTFNTPSQDLQIEYYDSAIVKNGSIRSFDYSWPGDFAVNSLSIQIQQPLGASQFSIDPVMGSPRQGLDGLNYYSSVEGTIKAGQTFTIHISYKNPNNVLSSSMQPVQPVKPINNSTSGRVTFQELLPWALGLLGVLLISGGAWWYLRVSNEIKTNPQKQNKKVDGSKPLKEMDPSANIFCQQCGRKASPGDQYCRTCGTRLHTE